MVVFMYVWNFWWKLLRESLWINFYHFSPKILKLLVRVGAKTCFYVTLTLDWPNRNFLKVKPFWKTTQKAHESGIAIFLQQLQWWTQFCNIWIKSSYPALSGRTSVWLSHIYMFLLNSKQKSCRGRIYHKAFRKKKPKHNTKVFLFWIQTQQHFQGQCG